jgi:hypothetical protein
MRALHESFSLAAAAANAFAAGRRQSAEQSVALAETQYEASLKILLTATNLTGPQRDEFHRELSDCTDALAVLNCRINNR